MPAPDPDVGTCRVCHDPIRFVYLGNGRRMPVELDPDPTGRLATDVQRQGAAYVNGEFLMPQDAAYGRERWRPHSDVCRQRKGRHAPPADVLAQIRADIRAAREAQELEDAKWRARG